MTRTQRRKLMSAVEVAARRLRDTKDRIAVLAEGMLSIEERQEMGRLQHERTVRWDQIQSLNARLREAPVLAGRDLP